MCLAAAPFRAPPPGQRGQRDATISALSQALRNLMNGTNDSGPVVARAFVPTS